MNGTITKTTRAATTPKSLNDLITYVGTTAAAIVHKLNQIRAITEEIKEIKENIAQLQDPDLSAEWLPEDATDLADIIEVFESDLQSAKDARAEFKAAVRSEKHAIDQAVANYIAQGSAARRLGKIPYK